MQQATRPTLTEQIARLHTALAADGVVVNDMRRAQSLELQFAGTLDSPTRPRRAIGIEPLEGPIERRPVSRIAPRDSRLRYFLDGAQRTLLAFRCNTVPILVSVAAAAILKRDEQGRCEVVPRTLCLEHALIVPRQHSDPKLQHMLDGLDRHGLRVIDPLAVNPVDAEVDSASHNLADYGFLVEASYRAARTLREELEFDLLKRWESGIVDPGGEDWLVVDGRLHEPVPRAIGLVKQFSDAYLSGNDAAMLLDLPPGYRTTAFFPSEKGRRGGPGPNRRTLWYLRMWDAAGLDARYALVRVETDPAIHATAEIDKLASWLWAERTPRATQDPRWATLLYPVHYLERILKRCLDADTQGWPGA